MDNSCSGRCYRWAARDYGDAIDQALSAREPYALTEMQQVITADGDVAQMPLIRNAKAMKETLAAWQRFKQVEVTLELLGVRVVQEGNSVVSENPRQFADVTVYDGQVSMNDRIKAKKEIYRPVRHH